MNPFKIGMIWVTIAFIVVLTSLLLPLLVFVDETLTNHHTVTIEYTIRDNIMNVTVSYRGTIPLTDTKVIVGNETVKFGTLRTGDTKNGTFNVTGMDNIRIILTFRVDGIYPMMVIHNATV